MKSVSVLRFITGGMVTGLILNVGGLTLVHFFLSGSMKEMIERFGGLPSWAPLAHLTMRFAIGFGALWVLIATHSRFEAFPSALLVATFVSWMLVYPVPLETWWNVGTFSVRAILLTAIWGYFELLLATLAGWLVVGKP